jgi:hypothetical protein
MENQTFFVVLGLDSERKPHAARFNVVDEAVVRKAAGAKGFQIGVAKTKEAAELASKLIEGKIFDSGRGLVPFVSQDIYDKLIKLLEINNAAPSPSKTAPPPAKPAPGHIVDPWAAIKIGTVVLARELDPGPDKSWWEATVQEISSKGIFVCRWTRYPKEPPFRVKRSAVAILPKS